MATLRSNLLVAGGVGIGSQANISPVDSGIAASRQRSSLFDLSSPATWSFIFFGLAVGYVAFMYFGHGGTRGSVI